MTRFALTRSWAGAPRRELVVSEVEGGQVVAIPTLDPSRPLVVWLIDITACVVLGAPSAPGPAGIRRLRSEHDVFQPVLPDGTALAREPVVADLTTGGAATLALVIEPARRVTVSEGGRRSDLDADVVLCSPEEPDAVARALDVLGVPVDTTPTPSRSATSAPGPKRRYRRPVVRRHHAGCRGPWPGSRSWAPSRSRLGSRALR